MSAISPSRKSSLAFWQSLGQKSLGYWLIFPALLVILGLNLYPTIQGILTSFTNQSLIDPGHSLYIGLDNYFKLLKEPVFQVALAHSLELTFFAVVLQVLLGLVMAHLLIQKVPGIHFFRSVAMITWVLPIIASVVMFRFMTLPNYGLVNILLRDVGLGHLARNWFGDEKFAFPLVLIMHLWRNVPFYSIAFMAAMQAIPADLYEAARIDGAGDWRQFWFVTLPNLRYIILVMVVLHVTFTFNNFDFVFLSTGGGSGQCHGSVADLHLQAGLERICAWLCQCRWRDHAGDPGFPGAGLQQVHQRLVRKMRRPFPDPPASSSIADFPSSICFCFYRSSGLFSRASAAVIRFNRDGYFPAWSELTFRNYIETFQISNFVTYVVNSCVIAFSVMVLTVFLGSLGAYSLSRFAMKGKKYFS